uniref:Dual oxidase maturation factor 2 n=1 Tax=Oryzias latipes TaxID=8090 RepID=A0A3B3I5X7_ORYLA
MTFYNDIYPFYPLQRISFIFSGRLLTIILVFLVLASTLLLILPGIRGKSRLFWMLRIITSLFIGGVIVVLNFTDNWAEARMTTNATYKSFSSAVINAEVGLHVGLYGNPVVQFNETINYNEMFSWHDLTEEEYEEALEKGLPNPILYIVEKFTLNSPCGLIFQYRYSGRFASATLWTAFCSWMLSNILFSMPVILYAGYMMIVTAGFIFFSMASFSTIMNVPQCVFSIGTDSVSTEYSHSFWLALATGTVDIQLIISLENETEKWGRFPLTEVSSRSSVQQSNCNFVQFLITFIQHKHIHTLIYSQSKVLIPLHCF